MNEKTYALTDLEALVGIPRRTIRSYIEKGLLPEPIGSGRGAYYDDNHLLRLCAIRVMRDLDSRLLSDIRRHLVGRDASDLLDYARRLVGREPTLSEGLARALPALGEPEREPETALDYVLKIRRQRGPNAGAIMASAEPPEPWAVPESRASEEPAESISRSESRDLPAKEISDEAHRSMAVANELRRLPSRALALRAKSEVAPGREARRRVRAEPVLRIAVTPDVDLIVRGSYEQEEIDRIERAAEQLRRTLMEGRDDE